MFIWRSSRPGAKAGIVGLPLVAAVSGTTFALVPGTAHAGYPDPGRVAGDTGIHDPSMARTAGGYVLYGSNEGLDARTSPDRTTFTDAGSAFPQPLDWWAEYSPRKSPWAPDITEADGTYYLYYAVSTFGSTHSAIGLATSSTGEPGSFTDRGVVHSTTDASDYNAIDPDLFVDGDGSWWLTFGSWQSGIKSIRLDPGTGKQSPSDRTVHALAAEAPDVQGVEGPAMVKHGSHYYLFSSYGKCCAGTDSTYSIRVGRSTGPTGPYTDRSGKPLTQGGGSPVLESHGDITGPGGQDVQHDEDGDILVYHYYDKAAGGAPELGINRVDWQDGWPTVH